ncbi:kelch-like protein 28 [Arctopsyche grandis]|uniref:kelch-like protein 28 n=1 Tax=Arctopsyche grandis TaxID=121162 RepID=UPI00406D66A9
MCERTLTNVHDMHSKKGFDRIIEMKKLEKFCDLDVLVGSQTYPVHSNIMASYSDYFYDLNPNFCNLSRYLVEINDIDSDVMKKIITFCYTGKIDLNGDGVENIYKAAEILRIQSLLEMCGNFLENTINNNNCFLVAKFGSYNSKILAKEFIEFNFNEVCLTEAFLTIEFNLLVEILKSDNLNVASESIVFSSVKRWVNHDFSKRKDYLNSLYEFIKLPLLPTEILFDELAPFISGNNSSIVSEAIQWKTIPNRRTQLDSLRNVPRKSAILALSLGDHNVEFTKMAMLYDPETNSMTEFMDLKTETKNFSAVIFGDEIVIMGGYTGTNVFRNEVFSYNVRTGLKSVLPPMLETRSRPVVIVIDGFLYAIGGFDGKSQLKTAERFDPSSQTWTYIDPMMTARNDHNGVLLDNILYIIGGFYVTHLNSVESYCPSSGKWKNLSPMIDRRQFPGVGAAGGFIYAIGGWIGSNLSTVERYNPKTDTWIKMASMSVARYALGVCAYGEKLLAYGGGNGSVTIADLEEYDPATNKWRTLTSTVKRGHFNFITVSKGWLKRLKPSAVPN